MQKIIHFQSKTIFSFNSLQVSFDFTVLFIERVHLTLPLTLPPHIISVQVKSQSMLYHGSVGASLKQNERNLMKPNPNP